MSDELSTNNKILLPCLKILHIVTNDHYSESRSILCDEKLLKLLTELLARGKQDNNISAISKLMKISLDADLDYGSNLTLCKKMTNSNLLGNIKTFFDKPGNFKSNNSVDLLGLLSQGTYKKQVSLRS